jgi:acetoin utilization deacetylase AcuC-like enzyme
MTADGYARLTARLVAGADRWCDGRILFVSEGGYHTGALAQCLTKIIEVASGRTTLDFSSAVPGDTRRGREALAVVMEAQRPFWKFPRST